MTKVAEGTESKEALSRAEREESLTNTERETIINFNESETTCYVYTHNRRWQRHIETVLKLKPTSTNSHSGKEYEMPKKWLKLPRMPRKLDEKQRAAATERLVGARVKFKADKTAGKKA